MDDRVAWAPAVLTAETRAAPSALGMEKVSSAWATQSFSEASEAAAAFKRCLLANYKNGLKGWRQCLDQDNSNRVSFLEFETAAKKMRFSGDVAGAWKFLDDDLSGFITLAEIDEECNDILV